MSRPYWNSYQAGEMLTRIRTAKGFIRSALEMAIKLEAEGYSEASNLREELEEVLTKLTLSESVSYVRVRREIALKVGW
jgi:hypothetical protein